MKKGKIVISKNGPYLVSGSGELRFLSLCEGSHINMRFNDGYESLSK